MPEGVIQRADQYLADKFNKGVLTPDKSAALVANPEVYNSALSKMYNEKYSSSFEDFDKFKSAYQSQYGDPFKKKEPTVSSPEKKVQSFDTQDRTQTPLNEALTEQSNQTQELPSENFVTPLKGTQVATFQTGGERQQIPVEEAQQTLNLQYKQQEADALRSNMYSKGLLQNAEQIVNTSNPITPKTNFSVAKESTGVNKPIESLEDKGRGQAQYSALDNAIDYTKITARQITGVIPGLIDVRNTALEYAWEKVSGNPGAYTQEERDAAFANANLAQKAWAYYSGERATAAYNEFEKNYMTGSRANEESEAGAYASAVGQIIPMFLTGWASAEIKAAQLAFKGASAEIKGAQLAFKGASALNKAKFLVNGAGKLIVETAKSPSTYIAAQQIFNDTFQQAYEATGDSDKAMLAAGLNTAASAGLEALPFLNFTKRLDNMTGGTVKKVMVSGAVGGGSELITEVAQTWTDNLVASNIYDETRQLTDGLYQSGEIGGVVGFTMSAVMAALHIRLKNARDPYERQEIEKAIADTAAKQQQVQKRETILENAIENTAVVKTNEKVQDVLDTPNIGTEQIVEANQIRKEMPNEEQIGHKTVGMTNRINELMVEKNGLYNKISGGPNVVEQTKVADARALAIDQEIRKLSNDIAEVYAAPSKQAIEKETEPEIGVVEKRVEKPTQSSEMKKKAFVEAGELSKKEQTPQALGNFIIDNAQVGDRIIINDNDYYEVAAKKTNKKGQTETELQFFSKNEETGEFENIPSGIRLFSDKYRGTDLEKLSYRNASDLFESSYTNNKGERIVEQSTFQPKEDRESTAINSKEKSSQAQEEVAPTEEEDLSDPEVVATKYHEERTNPVHITPSERAIADLLTSGVSKEGVQRQGDINKFNNSMARAYFKEGGQTIDQIAQQASSTINPEGDGNEVTPEDVWDFMNKFPQGPDQIDRPAGNPRLKQLAEKYQELTGKQLNKTAAKKIAEASKQAPEAKVEDPNSIIDKYVNEDQSINLDALESDIPALAFLYDLSEEQVNQVKQYVKETREANRVRSESADQGKTEPAPSKSEKVTLANKADTIREIKEKKLTHVQGVAMGSGVAKGTYLSTEKGNRYQGRGKKFNAEVEVENPYTTSENNLNKERGDVLKSNIDQFSETDFEGAEIPENPTIDDLSDSGTEKLADLFTRNLQEQGYDSMYFQESNTQEGELVVFDKGKVKLTEDNEIENDAINLTQGEFEAKHPGEDYETIRLYAFKDTQVAMEANKKSENPDNLVMYANGLNIPFTIGNIPKKVKSLWIKTFQKGAGIPYQFVYEISVKRKSTIDRRTEELNKLVKNIHKNILKKINEDIDQKIKDNPKEKSTLNLSRPKHNVLPEDIALELNDRFAGRKTSGSLPDTILLEIDTARNAIISLQKEMVALDLLDTDIHLGRNEKGEYYVNRTYRKFDDKGWKDKIPQKVMNKAILVLRDLYNSRDTNVESLANKKEKVIKSVQQKIEDRNTNLEDKKLLVANTVRKIDKKIKVDSKNANIPTQDIDVLEQRKKNLLTKLAKLESGTKSKNKKAEFYIKKAKKDLENFLRDNKGNTEIDIDGYIERDIQRFITSDPDAYSGNASAESARVVSSIFKTKSEFLTDNQALREVMGEVKDPFINILNTAHKMITTIENYNSQKRMKDMGMDVLFSTKPSKKFNTELKADGMPGLTEDGQLYTTPEFAESFKIMESSAPQVTSELLKTIGNGLGWIKMGKTVMSTPAAINNYVSNVKHIATNGWLPYYALKNYATLSKAEKVEDVKDLLDRGVLSQSIMGRELQDRKRALIGGFSIKETVSRTPMLDVGAKVLGAVSDFHAKIFANGDNYAKYVGFYAELNALRDIYPNWNEGQLRNEAAIIVSKISPTFDMVSPGVEKIRRSNLFSTFATFPAEQLRNRYNVGLLIKEDFKSGDKERIKRGVRRLSGQLVGVGLSAALLSLSKYFIGIGYEELKDLQIFQSQYSKNNAIVYLDRNGDEVEYMDVSRADYDSYLLVAPLIAYVTDEYDKEQFENGLIRSAQALSSPFTDTNILTETMADVIYGRKLDSGDAIFSDNDTFSEKIRKSSKHALSKLEPTNVKIARTWYDLADTGKDEYGGTITPRTAIIKTIGFGGRTLNVTKQFTYHYYTIKAQNDDDKNKFERSYNNARTDEEKEKAIQRYTQQLTIGISKMAHLSRVAQQNGGNMTNISDLINKLPKELRYAVAYGEIPEYKKHPVIQVGVDSYVKKTIETLINKK